MIIEHQLSKGSVKNINYNNSDTYIHTHKIYIYIYVCVCVNSGVQYNKMMETHSVPEQAQACDEHISPIGASTTNCRVVRWNSATLHCTLHTCTNRLENINKDCTLHKCTNRHENINKDYRFICTNCDPPLTIKIDIFEKSKF
jgi:hypothetical protein